MNIAKFFQKALDCQKNDQADMAITLYREILIKDPEHLATLYNLATLYGERGEYATAQKHYDKLIELEPDFVKSYFNSAVCQLQQKNITKAQTLLEQAVALVPEYSAAQHLLGSLIFKQGHWQEAKNHLALALAHDKENAEILNHLGMACLHLGELNEAEHYLKQAIKLMPYLAEAQYHLGVIFLKRGDFEGAQRQFQEATDRDPQHFGAWYNLGLLHKQQGFLKLADECLSKAQAIQPDSEYVAFLRVAVNHSHTPEHPPEGFVQDLFDRYAGYYDAQMQEGVDYQVPAQLYHCFKEYADVPPRNLTIVDLGCGTGLAGELFRPQAKLLIGIDLSTEMLAQARQKELYDDLQQGDVLQCLSSFAPESVDVFIAADVLGYIGKLEPLFEKIYAVLKSEGYWVFSIECGEHEMELSERIRFTYSEDYIRQLCDRLGFTVVHAQTAMLRKQVDGVYFVVRK